MTMTYRQTLQAAVAGGIDPRSVRRYVRGLRVQPMVKERIERGLREIGRADLILSPAGAGVTP